MSTAATIYPDGTLIKLKELQPRGEGQGALPKGFQITVECYVAGDAADNDTPDKRAYYWGDQPNGGGSYWLYADNVELVKTVEQLAARRVPTAEEIISQLDCLADYDGFEIDTAFAPSGNTRTLGGETDDGLPFSFYIHVTNVQENDF